MSASTLRNKIRSQIRPYPRFASYPTSWNGAMTFREIYDDLVHYATNIMKLKGIHRTNYLPECIQCGFMALWETLVADNDFLAQKSRRQAVFFILARCKISSHRYYDDKIDSLEELLSYDWRNNWDEQTITGFSTVTKWYNSVEHWATWALEVDIRLDVTRIMHKLADKYADSFENLVALYAVTTQITYTETASLAGVAPTTWSRKYIVPMLQEVAYEFAEAFLEDHSYTLPERKESDPDGWRYTSPYKEWREAYNAGNTAPAEALLEKYAHTDCIIGALRAQIAGKSYRQAALDLGKNPKGFPRYMKRAARMLNAAYA
jgi:hypothetical protein